MCSGKGSWEQEGLRVSDHTVQEYSSVPFSPLDARPISLDNPLTMALGKNPSAFSILESKGPLCMTASQTVCDSLHSLQGLFRYCFNCVGFGKNSASRVRKLQPRERFFRQLNLLS